MAFRSISTVRADVARKRFGAAGQGIVWAIIGPGISGKHRHFRMHKNLELSPPLEHMDLTVEDGPGDPLTDGTGRGTHIAGIIAGELESEELAGSGIDAGRISGMAPQCRLLSMKVIDAAGSGDELAVLRALNEIRRMNANGREVRIHGVNFAVNFPQNVSYPCGRSPVCEAVNELVRSGVVVVAPAGNEGIARGQGVSGFEFVHGLELAISDPGNAELAITVGATHTTRPEEYGVSYFSAKGPTLDGRMKPDLVAPGERIYSATTNETDYEVYDGTSMAAAHVSGVIAAFLSVRPDLIGKPETVKQRFLSTATDLRRYSSFQGRGLVDLVRALEPEYPAQTAPARERRPLRLIFSYAHEDESLRDELEVYLAPLKHEGLIETWHDRRIVAGSEWNEEIKSHLEQAEIVVLLVSAYFLNSDYAYGVEMRRAVERHDGRTARVIPVMLRDCDWSNSPFAKLQALPAEADPVTSWPDKAKAWTNVAKGIRKAVEELRA